MMRALVAPLYGFLLAAPLIVVYYSFSPGVVLEFPPKELTLTWYANLFERQRLVQAIGVSAFVATFATTVALMAGVPAAYALTRGHFVGRRALAALFLSPLVLPGLVLALGLLMAMSTLAPGLVGTVWPLLGAHGLITLPWVIRAVSASLETTDPHLEDAARGLGATPLAAFFLVTIPAIRPGVAAAAAFAFIVSFGNFALSMFFTSGTVTTLPVAIFEYIDQFQDPTVAAASTLVIVGTAVLVGLTARLRKMELP